MELYKKPGRRYELASNAEIVLAAVQVLNATPGGKEVTNLLALKAMQGKLIIKSEPGIVIDGRNPTIFACPKCDEEFDTTEECRKHIRYCEEEGENED